MTLGLAILLSLASSSSAFAHKIVASVWTEGNAIEGEVGFSNGDMAPEGTRVEVLSPDGKVLGETLTDADGLFRFVPDQPVAHTFRANLGAGHFAEAALGADELPLALIRGAAAANSESADPAIGATSPVPPALATADLEVLINEALRREIQPLRKELAAYREKNDLQSVLGGLGYICGIFGLAFFIYARRGNAAK
jgi:nickel transport protein